MTMQNTKGGFFREFFSLVRACAIFFVLSSVIAAALFSHGSWNHFFSSSLPEYSLLCMAVWSLMLVYYAFHRQKNGAYSGTGYDDDADDGHGVNPANGLPMAGAGGVDVGGHTYGTDD